MTNQEQQIENLKLLAYQHISLAHELCSQAYLAGAGNIPIVSECIERINRAGKDFEAYIETGKLPNNQLT
jgi:hypothetical protein